MELEQGKTFENENYADHQLNPTEYDQCKFIQCDFSNANLCDSKFIDCVFIQCNLSNTKIRNTAFREVIFEQCKLLGTPFESCNEFGLEFTFKECTLDHSSFFQRKIKKTKFINSQIREVDFTECDLSSSTFENCDLTRSIFFNSIMLGVDFRTALNFSIDPEKNQIKKSKFSMEGLKGLLENHDLNIE